MSSSNTLQEGRRLIFGELVVAVLLGLLFCWLSKNGVSFESTMLAIIFSTILAHAGLFAFAVKSTGNRWAVIFIGVLATGFYSIIWSVVGWMPGRPELAVPLFVGVPLAMVVLGGVSWRSISLEDEVDAMAENGDWQGVVSTQRKWSKAHDIASFLSWGLLTLLPIFTVFGFIGILVTCMVGWGYPDQFAEAEIPVNLNSIGNISFLVFLLFIAVLLFCQSWSDSLYRINRKIEWEISMTFFQFEDIDKSFKGHWYASNCEKASLITDHLGCGKLGYSPAVFHPSESALVEPGQMDKWKREVGKALADSKAVIKIWRAFTAGDVEAEAIIASPWQNWEAVAKIGDRFGIPEKIDEYVAGVPLDDIIASAKRSMIKEAGGDGTQKKVPPIPPNRQPNVPQIQKGRNET